MRRSGIVVAFIVLTAACIPAIGQSAETAGTFTIDANFPGGNIIVERIDGNVVSLRQDLRDTAGDWFYWCFRVRDGGGRTLTFRFTGGNVFTSGGPACSTDGGRTWRWLGRQAVTVTPVAASKPAAESAPTVAKSRPIPIASFSFAIPPEASDVRFCLAVPYLEADLKAFLAKYEHNEALKVATLCKTREGRLVEAILLGRMDANCDYRLAFTCRHHCCEMMASYVLEGLMDSFLADDQTGQWYRKHAAIVTIPFMDKDGVEDGDQGKNRKPHDHNRDYNGPNLYASVAAVKELLGPANRGMAVPAMSPTGVSPVEQFKDFPPAWPAAGRLDFALDLHCPSRLDNKLQLIGVPNKAMDKPVASLSAILERTRKGPLPYFANENVPYGTSWNQKNPGDLMSFGRWACGLDGILLANTLETPYADIHGVPVTPQSARLLGRDLAEAIRIFLQTERPRGADGK